MSEQALIKDRANELRHLLVRMKPQLQAALPEGIIADRVARVAMTTIQKSPMLLESTTTSLIGAVLESAQLGLTVDGVLGHAYLVPFKNRDRGVVECQLMVGYRGYCLMAFRSAGVIINAETVYSKDVFEYQKGTDAFIRHRPTTGPRGSLVAAYAVATFPDGRQEFEVMSLEQINLIRSQSKAGDKGPWKTHFEEMARKCPVRKLAKILPISQEVTRAAVLEERAEAGMSQELTVEGLEDAIDVDFASQEKKEGLKAKLDEKKEQSKKEQAAAKRKEAAAKKKAEAAKKKADAEAKTEDESKASGKASEEEDGSLPGMSGKNPTKPNF